MVDERVISQEEPAAVAAALPPVPPLGHEFDDPDRFEDYVVLGLPAPRVGADEHSLLGDDEDDGEAYNDSSSNESDKMTSSAEDPAVAGSSSSVSVRDDVSDGGVVDPPPSSEDEREHEGAVLGDEEDDLSDGDYDFSGDDSDADDDDPDNDDSDFEEDDEVPMVKDGGVAAAPGTFLGQPARIATVQSTVYFMTLAASSVPKPPCQCHPGGGEIIVDYRYTRFLRRKRSGGGDADDDGGVDMFLEPKQARLRFVLPSPLASGGPVTTAGSLRFAGAVLASEVYPARFSAQLQALWSVTTMSVPVPPRATCLLVTVNVGILRPGDCTPARIGRMCAALEFVALERAALPPPPAFDVAMELHLPTLLRSEDDVRPMKRRRVTGEDCPICFEVLEVVGLAAWPRCSHIFHASCLEQHLLRGKQECPICRSQLNLSPTPCAN